MKTGKIQTEVPNMETKYFVAHFVHITIFKVLLHYGQAFDTTNYKSPVSSAKQFFEHGEGNFSIQDSLIGIFSVSIWPLCYKLLTVLSKRESSRSGVQEGAMYQWSNYRMTAL